MLQLFYRSSHGRDGTFEECFYVDVERALTPAEIDRMQWLFTSPGMNVARSSFFENADVIEIGPRLSVETPFSSNLVAVCRSMKVPVRRIESSKRYRMSLGDGEVLRAHLDVMTQEVYEQPLCTFDSGHMPEPVSKVLVLEEGEDALRTENKSLGLGMDAWDISFYAQLFKRLNRNPTDVELFQIGNGNSEHSRHWFFRGVQIIDGMEMAESLMDVVKEPWKRNPGINLVAFHDNAGVTLGPLVDVFAPQYPGRPSPFGVFRARQHHCATAETHNHPTYKAPFRGAETGAGGRIRDTRAVGRGALAHVGFAGYCAGNLHLPGFEIPGECLGGEKSERDASPLDILIQGSNGVSDYGNKIGEPLIGGFCRLFGQTVNGQRREFRKPVLYSAGVGTLLDEHLNKHAPEKGMRIVRIGGPAYRIGVGGGSASSIASGTQDHVLDLKSVQRGDAEMENRVNRVIQACAELRDRNPIESIHDQGAGGPSNVLTELMEPLGGTIDIRKIIVGDTTMSVLEIWVAEYQEGYGLLVRPENLNTLVSLCARERVNCEVLGEITGDGNVVVEDPLDNTTPVNLSLKDILSEMPAKRFESARIRRSLPPLVIPSGVSVSELFRLVCLLPQVGSKGFLTRKVDRSVTGLVARQQCAGPTQVPVCGCAVKADGYFGHSGVATAFGEQPNIMLISPQAGARMAVAEMLTNLCSARISALSDVSCRANWMWAAKLPGEGALLYDAGCAMRDLMLELGIAINGGKDSLSMTGVIHDELAIAPGQLVIMGSAPMSNVAEVSTPDLSGGGMLALIDLGLGKNRLGGSSLAQAFGQLGNESPDVDEPQVLKRAFTFVQHLIAENLITAYQDRSDGGLITAIAEMCIAGNKGALIELKGGDEVLPHLFSQEAGMVCEYSAQHAVRIRALAHDYQVPWCPLGTTHSEEKVLSITAAGETVFKHTIVEIRQWWEATSTRLEREQANPETVNEESRSHTDEETPDYVLSFVPSAPMYAETRTHKVAILREEGTNGDREMAAAFYHAGLEPHDVTMSDLREGRITSLEQFRGLVFPGGFSYADVAGSAKGWAGSIRFNPHVAHVFENFRARSDTFSLGVCNGCQLMTLIGWVPFKGLAEDAQPRLVHNTSGRFESRWATVKILESPALLLRGMEGSTLGIHVAHGEGKFEFRDYVVHHRVKQFNLAPLVFVGPNGEATEQYPYNPNGSPDGITALCSEDGRHLAMMPHSERCFLKWQWPWMPEQFRTLEASPWLKMFENARRWCDEH